MKNPIKSIIEKSKAKVDEYKQKIKEKEDGYNQKIKEKEEKNKFLNTVVPTKNVYRLSRTDSFDYYGNPVNYNKCEYFLIKDNFEQQAHCSGTAIQLTGENMGNSYPYNKVKDDCFVDYYREILNITTIENDEEVTYTQSGTKIKNLYEDSLTCAKKLTSSIHSLNDDRNSIIQYSKNSHIREYNLSVAQDNVNDLFNEIDNPSEM